jgi:hypothetical protein
VHFRSFYPVFFIQLLWPNEGAEMKNVVNQPSPRVRDTHPTLWEKARRTSPVLWWGSSIPLCQLWTESPIAPRHFEQESRQRRAGCEDSTEVNEKQAKDTTTIQAHPGRCVHSVALGSFPPHQRGPLPSSGVNRATQPSRPVPGECMSAAFLPVAF